MRISDLSSDVCSSDLASTFQFASRCASKESDVSVFSQETPANRVPKSPRNSCRLTSGCFWWLRNIQPSHTSVAMGAFAGGGGILRQARPDSRREILLVAAFYGRARKATAQFYPAMATHFEGVWPNAPILNEAERTPRSLCRF